MRRFPYLNRGSSDILHTVCPRSSDPLYISYYTKWVDTSWTYSTLNNLNFVYYRLKNLFCEKFPYDFIFILINDIFSQRKRKY